MYVLFVKGESAGAKWFFSKYWFINVSISSFGTYDLKETGFSKYNY